MSHKDVYDEFVGFQIDNVVETDTGPPPNTPIEFEYSNPAISIDTGSNFVSHDVIGGATVRQRIGEQPLEVSVSGVCKETTVKSLEQLRNVRDAVILHNRFSENALRVHVVSVSTQPFEDGGAAQLGDDEFLYSFDMELVEILESGDYPDN